MYYQVEQVLEQQEPEIEKFYKGRGLLICEAKQGLFALKEYFGSAQKAEFLYWLGICLEQQGILNPDVVWHIWNDYVEHDNWRDQIWYILMFQSWMVNERAA